MRASYKISEADARIIRERMRVEKRTSVVRRLEAVALLGEGKSPEEVGEIKQYHPKHVRKLGLHKDTM